MISLNSSRQRLGHRTEGNAKSLLKKPQNFHRKQPPLPDNELTVILEITILLYIHSTTIH